MVQRVQHRVPQLLLHIVFRVFQQLIKYQQFSPGTTTDAVKTDAKINTTAADHGGIVYDCRRGVSGKPILWDKNIYTNKR